MWFRYIDDVFFLWTHGEENLKRSLDNLNNYDPNKKFTHKYSKKEIPFLDFKVGIKNGNITTALYVKDTDRHQYLAKAFTLVACVHLKKTLRDTWLE